MNRNPEFGNLLGEESPGRLKSSCGSVRENRTFKAQSFKKILLKIAKEVAKSSSGIDENEEKASAIIMGILDGII